MSPIVSYIAGIASILALTIPTILLRTQIRKIFGWFVKLLNIEPFPLIFTLVNRIMAISSATSYLFLGYWLISIVRHVFYHFFQLGDFSFERLDTSTERQVYWLLLLVAVNVISASILLIFQVIFGLVKKFWKKGEKETDEFLNSGEIIPKEAVPRNYLAKMKRRQRRLEAQKPKKEK